MERMKATQEVRKNIYISERNGKNTIKCDKED